MNFNKLITKTFALILFGIATTMAATSIAPFTFGDTDTDEDNWHYLMKFKLWGTEGISFGNRDGIYDPRYYNKSTANYNGVNILDSLGWVGTAKGHLMSNGDGGYIDGPIIVGGSITNSGQQMKILTGPIRHTGTSIQATYSGTVCSGTSQSGNCSYDKVPEIRPNLEIPQLLEGTTLSGSFNVNGRTILNVNSRCPGTGVCDIFFNSIDFANDSRLVVQMPEGGQPTRIFTNALNFGTHPEIVVSYGSGDLKQNEYEGNLLIYVNSDITFANNDNMNIMGSIVSTGTIRLVCNIVFAGQLIANELEVGNEILAENFIFKSFIYPSPISDAPSTLSITGSNANKFTESDTWNQINLVLNKPTETDVSFEYCIDFYSASGVQGVYAGYQDVGAADTNHKFPICNKSESKKVTIKAGDTKAAGVYIKPLVDGYVEENEALWLQISNLEGAQLASNYEDDKGYKIFVVSNDALPTVSSALVVNVYEDVKHAFTASEFNFKHSTQTFASVIITSLPNKGSLLYDGKAVTKNQTIAKANLSKLTYQAAANDFGNKYTTFKYKVVGSGTGDNTSNEYTATVNVFPVNDKPTATDVVFIVNRQDNTVGGGAIEVIDVANERNVDTYTYSIVMVDGTDYMKFASVFEIVKLSNQNATIKVKSDAVLDKTKKQYVVYGAVKDNAATEKDSIAGQTKALTGPLMSNQFKITVKINDSTSDSSNTTFVKTDPLHFYVNDTAITDETENQRLWNELMKYKLWGTDSVVLNKEGFRITDTIGYTGTAKNSIIINNGRHTLGGPIISGKDLQIGYPGMGADYDSLKGPVRANELFLGSWYNTNYTSYEGTYCFEGPVYLANGRTTEIVSRFIANVHKAGGKIYADWDKDYTDSNLGELPGLPNLDLDGSYSDCPDYVPQPDRNLSVPVLDETGIAWEPAVELNSNYYGETKYIHVPPISKEDVDDDHTWYDKFVENIYFSRNYGKKLYILMPSSKKNANGKTGRLTRIFSKDGIDIQNSANDSKIQVAYVNDEATWNGSSWENIDTLTMMIVADSNYAGNLMFYTNADINWMPMNGNKEANFQGTYITSGRFNIYDHINVTGQLIAGKTLWFESDFDGEFHYVPFNAPETQTDTTSTNPKSSSSKAVSSSSNKLSSSSANIKSSSSPAINFQSMKISALLLDWAGESYHDSIDIDFGNVYGGNKYTKVGNDSTCQYGIIKQMVRDTLVNGQLVRVDSLVYPWDKCAAGHEIDKWFVPQVVAKDAAGNKYTNSAHKDIEFSLDNEGFWNVNYTNESGNCNDPVSPGFFPLDDFDYLDSAKTIKNPKFDWNVPGWVNSGSGFHLDTCMHNYSFAMKISTQFKYAKGQTFEIIGDDDFWIFINNKLALDYGGIHDKIEGAINLDTLGLKEGNVYPFHIFYAERNITGSNLKIRTSITFINSSSSSQNDKSSSSTKATSSSSTPIKDLSSSSTSGKSSSANAKSSSSSAKTLSSSGKTTSSSSSRHSGQDPESSSTQNKKSSSSKLSSSSSASGKSSSSNAKSSSSSSKIDSKSSSSTAKSSSSKPSSSSSTNAKTSSSSSKAVSSSSAKTSNGEIPDFYVKMIGPFEFEIVMDESLPSLAKKYAVMDMKGQVLTVGELNDKNAYVKVPTRGAYIVKVGLGYRRINVR
ncbi:fibro-slime domain-containing protein [Fibrobacter sp.]|uniref:fibro-slime domain-containing protein n=1 Tax=Fibrobacter sp. TaxID=35828 RepID=UPI0025BF3E6B|nr:fibro-slime domain-containing protein [Fibrobacter sp.]